MGYLQCIQKTSRWSLPMHEKYQYWKHYENMINHNSFQCHIGPIMFGGVTYKAGSSHMKVCWVRKHQFWRSCPFWTNGCFPKLGPKENPKWLVPLFKHGRFCMINWDSPCWETPTCIVCLIHCICRTGAWFVLISPFSSDLPSGKLT